LVGHPASYFVTRSLIRSAVFVLVFGAIGVARYCRRLSPRKAFGGSIPVPLRRAEFSRFGRSDLVTSSGGQQILTIETVVALVGPGIV
jgi:hypothetical protein